MKIHGRFYIVSWIFFSSNLYSIICNFTFHQNLCIWQFVFNKAQWIEFMDGVNIRNFFHKNIILATLCYGIRLQVQFFHLIVVELDNLSLARVVFHSKTFKNCCIILFQVFCLEYTPVWNYRNLVLMQPFSLVPQLV